VYFNLNPRAYKAQINLPIIGQSAPIGAVIPTNRSDRRKVYTESERLSRQFASLKPAKRTGGSWIGDMVSLRQNINLCEDCWRRYSGWWKADGVSYRPDWNFHKRGDCDGCGRVIVLLTPFYPEEFYDSRKIRANPRYIIKGVD
jgi:hypothetical protein